MQPGSAANINKLLSDIAVIVPLKFGIKVFILMLVRKLIECIKVNSKTEITIVFKGGIETTVEVEK